MKFRKKPVCIDAEKFTGNNGEFIAAFMHCQYPFIENGELKIGTLEGVMSARSGDWIIRGVKEEYYPCKPDIFEATYEMVAEENSGAVANEPPTAAAAPCPVHGDRYHLIEKLICDNCGLPI